MFNREALKEKTFSITCDNSQPDNYTFTWNDGEVETFITVSYTGAMILAKHFNSINYACSRFILGDKIHNVTVIVLLHSRLSCSVMKNDCNAFSKLTNIY